ncbi:MAG TPA: FAD-dependent oxidoreductase [Bryobacteraceae bacterium]|nr:FAD-dependent oxidoreductase [Bryobacteraceae bacterium]
MKRIAVIGAGISGMAAAYYLSRKHEVSLFEKDERLGGHTHTVTVDGLNIDTGFIVHNDRTYPNLIKLFAELGVATAPSDMSFSVSSSETGFEYSSRGLRGFFAQKKNLFAREHYRLLREIMRFNRLAPTLEEPIPLGQYLARENFDEVFLERYLYPMAGAVWSMSPESIAAFPALTLIRFFQNHGMLGINTHPKWRVVRGGSKQYVEPLIAPYVSRIYLNSNISGVVRGETGVTLQFTDRPGMDFDDVVFACHGNQILPMLAAPSDTERDVLGCFQTSRNEVCLHTDSAMLPARQSARAAWNYNLRPDKRTKSATVTYYMNRLQSLKAKTDYCVTLNANGEIDTSRVLMRLIYHHPLYTRQAIDAQSRWAEISGQNRTHFAGAYWFYGFHEDGLNSGLRVARHLGVNC